MGLRERIGLGGGKPNKAAVDLPEIFDEAFLRQLELLQVIARRLLSGR